MKNLYNLITVIILLLFSVIQAYCQDSTSISEYVGIPKSFSHPELFSESQRALISYAGLPSLDNDALKNSADSLANADSIVGVNYYGKGIGTTINIKQDAQYYNSHIDNGKLWIYKMSSATALGLQFYFSKFLIPDGSYLHIYSPDRSTILGPYTSLNNPQDTLRSIQFGTVPIYSNAVYFEYFESDSAEFPGSIIIANTIHVFKYTSDDESRSASCRKDAVCKAGWGQEINSVAEILFYNPTFGSYTGSASGALINNTNENGFPYFLTAAHIQYNSFYASANEDFANWQFVFDNERTECLPSFSGLPPSYSQVVYGASELASDGLNTNGSATGSDYLLLQLNATTTDLSNFGVCYSGWTLDSPLPGSTSDEYTFIHHPEGDTKKISSVNNLRTAYNFSPWLSANFYNADAVYGGAGASGSSGAPLYNSNHKIIGTTTGFLQNPAIVFDECDASTYAFEYFGRFSRHWALESLFKQYLDPLNLTNDASYHGPSTYCPNPACQIIEPPVTDSYQNLNQGIKINNIPGIPILCSTDDPDHLTIKPAIATQFHVDGYSKTVKCNTVESSSSPNGFRTGCERITVLLDIPTGKCKCNYFSYMVYITELDYSLNPIGVLHTRGYEVNTWSSGIHSISSFSINVPEVLGYSFVPGKYYSVGVGTIVSGNWTYSSQVVHILANSVNISNNSNVTTNIYSMNDVTIGNTTVSDPVSVTASSSVTINPQSTLEAGEYSIENVDCNSFRMAEIHNSNNAYTTPTHYSGNDYISNTPEAKKETLTLKSQNVTIFPNPNDGVFQVSVTKNNQPTGIREISVFNIYGKTVWITGESANNVFKIDLSSVSNGIYYIRTINDLGEIEMDKIVKQ